MSIPRICILSTSYPRFKTDQSGIFIARLVRALSKQGVSGNLIVPFDSSEEDKETEGSIVIHRYKYGIFTRGSLAFGSGIFPNLKMKPLRAFQIPGLFFGMLWKAYRLRESYDLLHAQWAFSGLVAWVGSYLTKKPFVLTLRGEDVKLLRKKLLKPIFSLCFKKAKKITVVSEHFQNEIGQRFELTAEQLTYLPNGVEFQAPSQDQIKRFMQEQVLQESTSYLLYVGRIIPLKRIELLIEALKYPSLKEYSLLLCGPIALSAAPYGDQLKKRVTELGLEKRVKFLGSIDPERISILLSLSKGYLSASTYEGRSNSLLEALASGKVSFVSNIPGHTEMIKDGYNGYVFEPQDLASLAQRIHNVLSNPAIRENISNAAKASVADLTWEKCASKYIDIYME